MNPTPESPQSDSALSPQIKKRIAIASSLVLVALASIPLLDSISKNDSRQTPASTPVSSGRIIQKQAASDAAPVLSLSEVESSAPAHPQPAASQAAAQAPVASRIPAAPQPGSPAQVTRSPAPAILPPLTHNSTPVVKAVHPDNSTHSATPPQATVTAAPPAHSPVIAARPHVATPRPAAPAATETVTAAVPQAAPAPAAPRAPVAAPAGSSFGYQVQLGLFASPGNAEKLIEDLKKRGISARTETRVQLGPFRTRAEAEESIRQLKALGYQPLLVPAGQH